MPQIEKGQSAPLNVTKKSNWRVFAGLGWDPNENVTLLDRAKAMAGGKPVEHDLDLACYIYDSEKRFITHVSAVADKFTDQTGKIFHSGDNAEGVGEGDDEQISIELKDLDAAIHSIVFVAWAKGGHVFGDVADAQVRLGDGYSDHTFLSTLLGREQDGEEKSAFIFARLVRDLAQEDEWLMHYIGEYTETVDAPEKRAQDIKNYL